MLPRTRHRPPTAMLNILLLPVVFVSVLQVAGCTRRPAPPPPPGGTYRSTSAGANFDQAVALTDGSGDIATLNLRGAHRPAHAPDDIFIAANGDGLVHSGDGGATWTRIAVPLATTTDVVLLKAGVLLASGANADGQGFIVRSADNGRQWETVHSIPLPSGEQAVGLLPLEEEPTSVLISLAADPWDETRLYAGTNVGTVLRGEQSGKTWRLFRALPTSPLGTGTSTGRGLVSLHPSPHEPDEVLTVTAEGGLFRVTPDGAEAITVIPPLDDEASKLAGVRQRGARVFAATFIPGFPDALFVGTASGGLITRDGGKSWQALPAPINPNEKFDRAVVAVSPTNTNRLFIGIKNVLYRSEDGGQTWNTFPFQFATHFLSDILIHPSNASHVLIVLAPVPDQRGGP